MLLLTLPNTNARYQQWYRFMVGDFFWKNFFFWVTTSPPKKVAIQVEGEVFSFVLFAMPDDLEQSIRENAEGPAEAHGDSGGMKQHSLKDQIEADRYLASKKAVTKKQRGIRLSKISPPGAQ